MNEGRYPLGHSIAPRGRKCRDDDRACQIDPNGHVPNAQVSVNSIALLHFVTRSKADFERKQARGGGLNQSGKPSEFFDEVAQCAAAACLTAPTFFRLQRTGLLSDILRAAMPCLASCESDTETFHSFRCV